MNPTLPILIVGQGLAGTAVAWQLWERGVPFLIVDPNHSQTCSKVAAGLITPITGMRLNLSWKVAELLPEAMDFYRGKEKRLGVSFYHELPHVRLFVEDREVALWAKRREDPKIAAYLESENNLVNDEVFRTELGGFRQRHSGWLDTNTYLSESRAFFDLNNCYQNGEVNESDLHMEANGVWWNDSQYSHVILCRGWQQAQSYHFPWLAFNSARGVMVDLKADIASDEIVNRRGWLLPHQNGVLRAGSTYEFDFTRTLQASLDELQNKLHSLLKVPFTMSHSRSGIRPIIKRRPAVMGRHPVHANMVLFNGLGSKGAMKSPSLARQLVTHILDKQALDAELDIRANF